MGSFADRMSHYRMPFLSRKRKDFVEWAFQAKKIGNYFNVKLSTRSSIPGGTWRAFKKLIEIVADCCECVHMFRSFNFVHAAFNVRYKIWIWGRAKSPLRQSQIHRQSAKSHFVLMELARWISRVHAINTQTHSRVHLTISQTYAQAYFLRREKPGAEVRRKSSSFLSFLSL